MSHHPLDPLSADELKAAAKLITSHVQEKYPGLKTYFKAMDLNPPPKSVLTPYLDSLAAGKSPAALPRHVEALIVLYGAPTPLYYEVYASLSSGSVDAMVAVPAGHHTGVDEEEMLAAEKALLAHPEFQEAIKALRLPKDAVVVADPWTFGADIRTPMPRLIPFMLYCRMADNPDSNHYAFPLPLQPVLDSGDNWKLITLGPCPIFGESDETLDALNGQFPWEKMKPKEYEYDAELRKEYGYKFREDLKPLQVVQPLGASFTVKGRIVEWQKWKMHIGFNLKEGIVISDVRYDGRLVFHRLSVSDMTVPKQAFDFGDVGAGICANNLQLGCDCLGEIYYMDWASISSTGEPVARPNVVCIHEQDNGIGWKHTNFRTGKASVTRSRVLVVQTIITVANYEYVFAWQFDQAAAAHLEIRATGILSTHIQVPGETSPYGVQVAPGVFAPNHQHIFSIRIDPAIDGYNNTVVQEDSVAMPFSAANPPANNPWGVGYTVEKTPFEESGFADAAPHKNRVFKIINESKKNPISGRPIGYKLVPNPSQLIIAHPESVAFARAEFAQHHIWVSKHADTEVFAGGKYTVQSSGNVKALGSWAGRKDKVRDSDLVLWHSFGLTHNTRETHMISLKPVDFFETSPAIDVPASTQKFNQSQLSSGDGCCKVPKPRTGAPDAAQVIDLVEKVEVRRLYIVNTIASVVLEHRQATEHAAAAVSALGRLKSAHREARRRFIPLAMKWREMLVYSNLDVPEMVADILDTYMPATDDDITTSTFTHMCYLLESERQDLLLFRRHFERRVAAREREKAEGILPELEFTKEVVKKLNEPRQLPPDSQPPFKIRPTSDAVTKSINQKLERAATKNQHALKKKKVEDPSPARGPVLKPVVLIERRLPGSARKGSPRSTTPASSSKSHSAKRNSPAPTTFHVAVPSPADLARVARLSSPAHKSAQKSADTTTVPEASSQFKLATSSGDVYVGVGANPRLREPEILAPDTSSDSRHPPSGSGSGSQGQSQSQSQSQSKNSEEDEDSLEYIDDDELARQIEAKKARLGAAAQTTGLSSTVMERVTSIADMGEEDDHSEVDDEEQVKDMLAQTAED
ncbi:hypothetical protein MNV49_004237 [Pseudohyphozyma bogoriensis]|nr:hypothetical protein MNV49_004237 [Pseudohyphozyma bogoriensis]